MKLLYIFITLLLCSQLNAGQSIIEQYTELRNNMNAKKIQASRDLMLQKRDTNHEIRNYRDVIRDYRSQAIYARVEKGYEYR